MAKKRPNPVKPTRVVVPASFEVEEKPDYTPTLTPAAAEIYPDKKGKKA
jgi:hypothetical protein